jgi:hypothetical protein
MQGKTINDDMSNLVAQQGDVGIAGQALGNCLSAGVDVMVS